MPPKKLPPGVYPSGRANYQYRIPLPKDPSTGKRGQIVKGGFATPDAAYLAKAERKAQLGLGPMPEPVRPPTLAEWFPRWLDRHDAGGHIKPITRWNYEGTWRRDVAPHLGHVQLPALTVGQVRDWLAALTRAKSAAAARNARQLLVLVLNGALDEHLTQNVASRARAPKHRPAVKIVWSDAELRRFLDAVDQHADQPGYWYLCLLGQLRPGEVAALRWDDLDLDAGMVSLSRTRTRTVRGGWTIGEDTKTPAGTRRFQLPAVVVRVLREHRRNEIARRLSAPPGVDVGWDWTLVFPSPRKGRVLCSEVVDGRMRRLCALADVRPATAHSLRGMGASLLAAMGENPKVVADRLGHKDVRLTLNVYTHTNEAAQADVSRRLDEAITTLRKEAR